MHWPSSVDDIGLGGATFPEMLILYDCWTGERLGIELAVHQNTRTGRPICMSPVPDGLGIEIWRSCRFPGSMFRALNGPPGGLLEESSSE